MHLNININLRAFLQRTGLTLDEIHSLELPVGSEVLHVAVRTIVEEWATHTAIWDHSGRRIASFYPDESALAPRVVWRRELPKHQSEVFSANLELVIHENSIKFWSLNGRFGQKNPWEAIAEPCNTFVEIPLSTEELEPFRWKPEPVDDGLPNLSRERDWVRHYLHGNAIEEENSWSLSVTDVAAYFMSRY
jgi:hypothetical protein